MKTQYEDLVESEKTLQKVIEELDEGMRKQFKEKFEEIRVEFDRVFKELFGGGKGTLELVEDEDVIEAGISYYLTAARQEASEHDAAFRRREGAYCNCADVCYSEFKAVAVLSS